MGILWLNKWIEEGLNLPRILAALSFIILSFLFNLWIIRLKVKRPTRGKAFLLSLFNIGAGQLYNGHKKRGILFFNIFVGLTVYTSLSKMETFVQIMLIMVLIVPLEALVSGKSKPGSSGSGDSSSGRGYDSLDQVMDDMNNQFNDSLHNNW